MKGNHGLIIVRLVYTLYIFNDRVVIFLCSKSWLKKQLTRLNLRKRTEDPSDLEICLKIRVRHFFTLFLIDKVLFAMMQNILFTSDAVRGYRGIWRVLRDHYGMKVRRYNYIV